ncbi:unnamed protein product [Psylliodes chrysocephalus]|uniref:Uncharacterized protein n=1 Tax=Psylliodes chrysocephalus TaxID=3402493 RepID=A0A9P0CXJ8_9CUCU|nr:unnamed protein product [Psylliodes chrysocephala]
MTGCDYVPALYRKGKKKPLQIVLQNEEFQDAFINNVKEAFPCLNDLYVETASSDEETNEDEDDNALSDGIAETDVDAFDYNADLSDDVSFFKNKFQINLSKYF